MWQDLFSGILGKNHLNIKAGNVGRHSIALPNSRNENKFSIDGYLYQDELNLGTQPGFQVNGFGSRWRYYAGIVQANTDTSNLKTTMAACLSKSVGWALTARE